MREFFFDVIPVPWARARTNGRIHFTPGKQRNSMAELRWLMAQAYTDPPLDCPIALTIKFMFLKPKSAKKRSQHTVKPDLSNLVKLVEDAGIGILWRDDALIWRIEAEKGYAEKAGIHVVLTT